MIIETKEIQPVISFNEKHLSIKEIGDVSYLPVPTQTIETYCNTFVTRTNFLFVNGKYEKSGLLVGDNKDLSIFKQYYLYIKYKFFFKTKKYSGIFLWYYDVWSVNYYHWLCETLPRLFELKTAYPECLVVLPISFKSQPFIIDSLRILNMDVLWIDSTKSHSYSKIVTVQTRPAHGDVNPIMQGKLNSAILKMCEIDLNKKPFRKVYLSRTNALYRKVLNEAEVIKIVVSLGYEVIRAETLSFMEQVQLFSETALLIAQHGAGITNMCFMQKHTKVLEIRNEGWNLQPLCFWRLANIQEMYWAYIIGQSISIPSNISDMIIDISEFKEAVTEFSSQLNLTRKTL